ncbi:MAG: alpha/beta hydrolase [Dehalococcoidia bacterium]|nr:alpha/beta hydrolase [Dehalococcoidia bacterium]
MYEELTLNINDDFEMSYIDTGSVSSNNEILLIHGWCSNKYHWKPQIDHFSNKYRVVALDLRGHGLSTAPESGYSFQQFAEDIEILINHLNISNPIVFGHSMGGAVAIYLTNLLQHRARGLIMVDGSIHIAEPSEQLDKNERIRSFKNNNPQDEIALRYSNFFSHMTSSELADQVIADAIKTPAHVALGSLFALYRDDASVPGQFINVPSLYIANAYSPHTELEVKKFVPNSNFAKVVQAGHFMHLESITQSNAMIDAFVAEI